MTTLQSQYQPNTKEILFTIVAQSESKTKYLDCLVDTGFDDFLILNSKDAESFNLKKLSVVIVETGGGIKSKQFRSQITISLPKINENKKFLIPVIIIDEPKPVIGLSLLKLFCNQFKCKIQIDLNNSVFELTA